MEPIDRIIAENLTRARQLKGMSQQEASEAVSAYLTDSDGKPKRLGRGAYAAIEATRLEGNTLRKATAEELVACARAFGVPVGFFFVPDNRDTSLAPTGENAVEVLKPLTADPDGVVELLWRITETAPDAARRAAERGAPADLVESHPKYVEVYSGPGGRVVGFRWEGSDVVVDHDGNRIGTDAEVDGERVFVPDAADAKLSTGPSL